MPIHVSPLDAPATSSQAPNIVDYSMVAARNLECHIGHGPANAAGIGLPFVIAWRFYFGHSFSDLVNLASPFLNGAVQFVVPALLFAAYERHDRGGGDAGGAHGGAADSGVAPPKSANGGGGGWGAARSALGSGSGGGGVAAGGASAGGMALPRGEGERWVRVLGLRMSVAAWRAVAGAIAAGMAALIAATYALNAAVGAGVIRPGSGSSGGGDYGGG
jgi:hypothetical protein